MAVFVSLIIPLPHNVKKRLFMFISNSPIVAKLQYGMKVGSSRIEASEIYMKLKHCR